MIELEKNKTNVGDIIKISKNDKTLYISRPYNNDLFISLSDKEYPSVFTIDLSDDNFYLLIDNLYNTIKNNGSEELFYKNIIDYHSDDYTYEHASRLIITKEQHEYRFVFFQNKKEKSENNTILISNKNSRYGNDSQPFFKMYNDLNNYDFKTRRLVK